MRSDAGRAGALAGGSFGLLLAFGCGDGGGPADDDTDPPADDDTGGGSPLDDLVTVDVDAGTFTMGCDPADLPGCPGGAAPAHGVTLSAYRIHRTEVTRAAYGACVDGGACTPAGEPLPAADGEEAPQTRVTWSQASAFCGWLGMRLPTEAEWERAARGLDASLYPWGDAEPDCALAAHADCVDALPAVGSYPAGASPDGVLDAAGSAWEWVADWIDPDYYAVSPAQDPTGPEDGDVKGIRGGSLGFPASSLASPGRGAYYPEVDAYGLGTWIGFRCAAPREGT